MKNKLKGFLRKIFWVDEFEGKRILLEFMSKFSMYLYIIMISLNLIFNILLFNLRGIILTLIGMIFFPIAYRIVMGFQRIIHKI
ncbi:hypothetical protein [uncultured Clostridium sp.]|uniref:hypothetical protein n=1 Tax=uncultured Clostridium sp. TaxID=59620 RepID=UPI0025869F9F|nr:hypothetical protein [uncultured Clostridium sp.]